MLPLLIGAGASLASGILGSRSASKAAKQQADAQRYAADLQLKSAREGNALTADMYRSNLGTLAPTIGAGQTALSALMSGMGLGALQTGNAGGQAQPTYLDRNGNPYGGPVTTNANGQPVDANGKVLTAREGFATPGITQAQSDAAAAPFAGTFMEQFTNQDLYRDPSYQWRLEQGNKALLARQAAGGNRWGSQAMKDISDYNQGAASQEYGNAYSRFMQQKQQLYDRLMGIVTPGQGATSGAVNAGSNAASSMSGNLMSAAGMAGNNIAGAGASQAGGTIGSTNALVGGINNAAGAYTANQYAQQFTDALNNMNLGRTGFTGVGNSPY